MLLDASIAVVVRQGIFKNYYHLQELSYVNQDFFDIVQTKQNTKIRAP